MGTTTSIQAANISISQQNGLTKRTSTTIRCIHSAKSHQQHQQPPSPQRKKWHPATRQKVYGRRIPTFLKVGLANMTNKAIINSSSIPGPTLQDQSGTIRTMM